MLYYTSTPYQIVHNICMIINETLQDLLVAVKQNQLEEVRYGLKKCLQKVDAILEYNLQAILQYGRDHICCINRNLSSPRRRGSTQLTQNYLT